jgi:DNA primase
MRDGAGTVVGIRLRNVAGDKWAVTGSRAGLFVPATLEPQRRVYVCEGPTDTAAALTIGLYAIGRPSCMGNEADVYATIRRLRIREAVIVADADAPGQRGAAKLVEGMPCVSCVWTPEGKDIREYVTKLGGDRETVEDSIRNLVWTWAH